MLYFCWAESRCANLASSIFTQSGILYFVSNLFWCPLAELTADAPIWLLVFSLKVVFCFILYFVLCIKCILVPSGWADSRWADLASRIYTRPGLLWWGTRRGILIKRDLLRNFQSSFCLKALALWLCRGCEMLKLTVSQSKYQFAHFNNMGECTISKYSFGAISQNFDFLPLQQHCNHNCVPQQTPSCSPEETMAGILITIKTVLLFNFQFSILITIKTVFQFSIFNFDHH